MKIDREKRKRIMSRSIRLGHCICDFSKKCPCEVFIKKDICHCAGETGTVLKKSAVRLLDFTKNAGCASKISPVLLSGLLSRLHGKRDADVLLGVEEGDDAGIYRVGETYLAQTVDVFTPCVNDAFTFGEIVAANSLSDIYATGGKPLFAVTVIGFPVDALPAETMLEILQGGASKMKEAGVSVIGGHSIKDPEIKFGYTVTGTVPKKNVRTKAQSKPGDMLILTKPVGTGIMTYAVQLGKLAEKDIRPVIKSMRELNLYALTALDGIKINALTDVTGFGLAGHLFEMMNKSGVSAELFTGRIPFFDGALELAGKEIVPGGTERNLEYALPAFGPEGGAFFASREGRPLMNAIFDPQTSGGLLVSVPEKDSDKALARLKSAGLSRASVIGRVLAKPRGKIFLGKSTMRVKENSQPEKNHTTCCCSCPK